MARRALQPEQLALVQAVRPCLDLPEVVASGVVRVACSGGGDSMALLAATVEATWQGLRRDDPTQQPAVRVEAVVVDHGLQPGSDEVARQVCQRVLELGAEPLLRTVEVVDDGSGLEASARAARLATLTGLGGVVLLGHTLDDQAETVLLGLVRGSGAASLQGMAWRRDQLLRPLLNLDRATVRRAAQQWGLQVWEDPMNTDPRYTRVRVRQALTDLESDLGPGLTRALGRTATLARQDNDLLERLAEDSLRDLDQPMGLDAVGLLHLHPALRSRVLRRWMVQRGVDQPGLVHVEAVLQLVEAWRGQQGVDCPGGIRIRRSGGLLVADNG